MNKAFIDYNNTLNLINDTNDENKIEEYHNELKWMEMENYNDEIKLKKIKSLLNMVNKKRKIINDMKDKLETEGDNLKESLDLWNVNIEKGEKIGNEIDRQNEILNKNYLRNLRIFSKLGISNNLIFQIQKKMKKNKLIYYGILVGFLLFLIIFIIVKLI